MARETFANIPSRGEADLRGLPPEQVISFLEVGVQKEGWLLHGSNRRYTYLTPHQGRDLVREEGCRYAIYATTIAPQALYMAIYNSRLNDAIRVACQELNRTDENTETFLGLPVRSFDSETGKDGKYAFTSYVYEHLIAGGADLLRDGCVHVLPRTSFVQEISDGRAHADWQAYDAVAPLAAYTVSRNIGRLLFQPPGQHPLYEARPYTPQEDLAIAQVITQSPHL